jgi:S1-C subfamily serine protease
MVSRACSVIVASVFMATRVLAQSAASGAGASSSPLARVSAATVTLEVQGVCCNVGGSGVLLTETGLIATSARVIEGARRVRVWLSTGERFDAEGALYYDHRLDLALILIPGVGLPSAPTANSDSLMVGQRLLAIGAPPDQEATVTDGRLSAVRTEDGVRRLRLSVPIPLSSSGGPIVNEQGKVVGLIVGAADGSTQQFNDGISINDVGSALGHLQGKTPTPFVEIVYGGTAETPVAGGGTAETPVTGGGTAETPMAGPSLGSSPIRNATGMARTNPDVDLDFRPLNGVVLYFEEQYAGQRSVRDSTGYVVSLSLTTEGNLGVERTNSREWRDQGAITPVAEQLLRTSYDIGQSDRSVSVLSMRPLASPIPTDSWELHIEGGRYWYSAAEGIHEGEATPGVVPREMLSAILAALPDNLPPEVHVPVLDALANRSQEVILRFGGHESRTIPVPRAGRECGANVLTRNVVVDAVQGTRSTGTETATIVVLARRPHVILGGAALGVTLHLKCAVIPGVVP